MAYLMAGGYALLHRRHVRIDVLYEGAAAAHPGPPRRLHLRLLRRLHGTLIWIGGADAWNAFRSARRRARRGTR
jgi:hypothetical protein